ncbi:MAG: prolyl oligopeptidase family serine peptidase [Victivallales bacterium]|nr:prolyl oligopeptidase family serine peptidase [Victivallales bacterium]
MTIIVPASPAGEPTIEAREFKDKDGGTLLYRILKPAGYDSKIKYPLVLCLHGAGGRGDDNQSRGTEAFRALNKVQAKYPAFLLTPQCPKDKQWVNTPWAKGSYSLNKVPISDELAMVVQIMDSVEKEFSIDPARIYVTGQSMGGFGTWDIIMRYPKKFAAAIPICGGGDPSQAKNIAHLPIWTYHGDKDNAVPIAGTREMVEALKKADGNIKYSEYKDGGHNIWVRAWKEEDLTQWLFNQQNKYIDSN